MCPICHTAGGDFPLADHQEGDFDEDAPSDLEIHLLCEICDEPFSPRFCRLCTNCEHDFGSGSEPQTANDHELTPRILIISIVLLAIAIGGMWYFSVVLGS